jgi:protein SCO1/2
MRRFLACSILALIALSGCHSKQDAGTQITGYLYHLRGKVVSTDTAHGIVVVDSEAIPGFMEAMTMPYQLKDPSIVTELHPGDVITADVLVQKSGEQTVLLDHIVVVAQGRPDYKPTVQYHVPAPGDKVPDFKLRNQDGREIHLAEFQGKSLLITFIYTRCPMPDFCPLVTRNFAAINNQLASDPALYAKTHLLSVTFDPEHDTPARLRAYGATYIGSDAKNAFSHWDFAAPAKPVLLDMAKFFDVGITHDADNSITHTLSTTLIGPDGKVVQFYPGNEWTPGQVVSDVKKINGNRG